MLFKYAILNDQNICLATTESEFELSYPNYIPISDDEFLTVQNKKYDGEIWSDEKYEIKDIIWGIVG